IGRQASQTRERERREPRSVEQQRWAVLLRVQRVTPEVEDQRFGSLTQTGDQRLHRVSQPALRGKGVHGEASVRFCQPAAEKLDVQLRVGDRGDLTVLLVRGGCDDGEAHDRASYSVHLNCPHQAIVQTEVRAKTGGVARIFPAEIQAQPLWGSNAWEARLRALLRPTSGGQALRLARLAPAGRLTTRSLPLLPPPQKKRPSPSPSKPEMRIPAGSSSCSSTSLVLRSTRRISLRSFSCVACHSSPSLKLTPVTKRSETTSLLLCQSLGRAPGFCDPHIGRPKASLRPKPSPRRPAAPAWATCKRPGPSGDRSCECDLGRVDRNIVRRRRCPRHKPLPARASARRSAGPALEVCRRWRTTPVHHRR